LSMDVHFARQTYTIGDEWRALLTYRNISNHPIRFVPYLPIYPASRFHITRVANGAHPEFILPGEVGSMDFEGVARSAELLPPGGHVDVVIRAQVSARLPKFYGNQKRNLYLVFSGHALRLPGFGAYKVETILDSPANSA